MSQCNGCYLEQLKKKYGSKLIKHAGSWYLVGEQPLPGQGEPYQLPNGTPIQFVVWFMGEGHDHTPSMAEESIDDSGGF